MDPSVNTEPALRDLIKKLELCLKVLTQSCQEPLPPNLATLSAEGLDKVVGEFAELLIALHEATSVKASTSKLLKGFMLTVLWGTIMSSTKSSSVLGEALVRLDPSGKLQEELTLTLKVAVASLK